jgi:hypothetical protein
VFFDSCSLLSIVQSRISRLPIISYLGVLLLIAKYALTQVLLFKFLNDFLNFKNSRLSHLNLFTLKSDILLEHLVQNTETKNENKFAT